MNTSEGQTQEPVGGMKWEDVQILAKKHAEHIIEMGWRDNPDKDDIIADFISGYASAPPPAPIKTEGEDEYKEAIKQILYLNDHGFTITSSLPVTGESEAIGFAEWIGNEVLEYDGKGNWLTPELKERNYKVYSVEYMNPKSTTELYNIYKQSNK